MANITKSIKYAMSLRTPQEEALSYLDAISQHCDYKKDSKADVEKIASEYCEKQNKIKVSDKFDFPSFCYAMATGIGKTRLIGACIYYLYKTKGYKHFFILAPGNTIYEKLRKESNPGQPKYIFKGLEAEMGRPKVYDGENYTSYPTLYDQMTLTTIKTSGIQLFIFNIGKIFNSKTDTQFNFHKFKENLGMSFADVLSGFDDLVICMDEAHRYYAPASMQAINYLKPILGLEFTATPKSTNNVIYSYDLARGAVEGYLKTPVVMGRSNMAGYSDEDIEEMKIRDGLTLHEHRKTVIKEYCDEHEEVDYVKPIVLIACKDTNHAKKIRELIDSDNFQNGKYRGKVIEIHSNMKGEETEENVRLLLSIERSDNPIEIVLHVYKLKEGWDVNNLFTIIPLNAAKSDILAMQTIGRGLRLPFGQATGNEDIDTLDIVAHDHYRELVDEIKNSDMFRYRDLDKTEVEPTDSVDVNTTMNDGQLSLFDMVLSDTGVKTFVEVQRDTKTQTDLYEAYLKLFGEMKSRNKKQEDENQMTLFDFFGTDASGESKSDTDVMEPSDGTDASSSEESKDKPMSKENFVKKIKEYSAKAISVPKILVQTTSEVKFNRFQVKRTIQDFEVAMAT
ncbi:DEAD/DEAH box helicase, partial [Parabacteroides goldsteinii]|uniref:DEAD/DEAH box helicase n=1 Tax=Parabacteroides goldsteinii TaxID=328812 RepID=UPI00260FEAC3